MTIYIQYDEEGTIQATVQTGGASPEPAHGRQIEVPDGTSIFGQRVDIESLSLVPCPELARLQANGVILAQLQALDQASVRAMREFQLTGDKTALQNLEDKAAKLRPQLTTEKAI